MDRRQFTKSAAAMAGMALAPSLAGKPEAYAGNEKKIRIAQIGTTHAHADGKMETLLRFPDLFEVAGIAEPDKAAWEASKNKKEYASLKHYQVDDLLKIPDLDAVTIETGLSDLLIYTGKSLTAGKHIHLDKPAGESPEQFRAVLDLAASENLILQMGYMFRYNPAFLFAREAVAKGWLGDIFEIDGVMSKVMRPQARAKEGPSYRDSMMILGCHLIDMLTAFMGKPDRVKSYRRQTLPDVDDMYDNELAVFEYPNAICTVRSALTEVGGWERRQFVICGMTGTIEIKPLEDPVLKLTLDRPRGPYQKGSQFVKLEYNGDRYDEQLHDFARMVRREKKPEYSYEHDYITQEALLKACARK